MTDMEYNRTSPFISNSLHYSSEIYPYVGEFHYLWLRRRGSAPHAARNTSETPSI